MFIYITVDKNKALLVLILDTFVMTRNITELFSYVYSHMYEKHLIYYFNVLNEALY